MRLSTLRAGRTPLAILTTALITITTVAACTGDQSVTAPPAHPATPSVPARDVATVAADSTLVTFNVNRDGEYYPNGYGGISGTYTCSRVLGEAFTVSVTLEQNDRDVGLVQSTSSYSLSCAQEGTLWEFFFAPVTAARYFKRGKAIATMRVVDGSPGVVHSTTTKTVRLVEFQ